MFTKTVFFTVLLSVFVKSDAWSQQPSDLTYYIKDCCIFNVLQLCCRENLPKSLYNTYLHKLGFNIPDIQDGISATRIHHFEEYMK